MNQIFLLSPARCDGERARLLLNPTASFELAGARFSNSQNSDADFRLVAQAPEYAVRKVALRRK